MSTLPIPFVTAEEYLDFDRNAEFKHELVDGEIVALAGGTLGHGRTCTNVIVALARVLPGACEVFASTIRVGIDRKRTYAYPDATVIRGKPEFLDNRKDTITNPKVIVEVLSASTRNYDLGAKARAYSKLPSLTDMLFLEQHEPAAEHWRRLDGGLWEVGSVSGLDAVVPLESIGCALPLPEIYRNVEFETGDTE